MNRIFQSKLAPHIEGLIREKQACGYLFNLYASHLARFDSFIITNGFNNGELDEPLFTAWAARLETENQNSRNSRVYAVCELAEYMEGLGCNVFHPYKLGRMEHTTPTIPTKDELEKLFTHIDRSRVKHSGFERFNIEYPILMRLYYHCGLRLNEAVGLRRRDVDLHLGTLYIRHSKGDKDRIVPLPEDLHALVLKYDERMVKAYIHDREWFFPGFYIGKPFSKTSIDKKFKELWMGSFPDWSGSRPTIHSLRHAFVVHRIDDWVVEGNNLKSFMPYLSRYLGHSSIEETMYYYHQLDARSKAVRGILESCCPVIKGASL
ncbi:MAG: integrase [Bacteroidia bacterium]|nr:tyrosine-type recombinase/integrase [uncultured Sphaerochaeta sp.]NCB97706.1 integrase [Bacteroidia bacterium]